MLKITHSLLLSLLFVSILFTYSCRHSEPAPVVVAQRTITLNAVNPHSKDTFYVVRTQTTAILQVIAMAPNQAQFPSRLYIYTRSIDNANPGPYVNYNYTGSGFSQDVKGQYYYSVPFTNDTTSFVVTVPLRANNINAVEDEFYFVYTRDTTFSGPLDTSPANLSTILYGPAQFFIVYGKLTEYTGTRIYNAYAYYDYYNTTTNSYTSSFYPAYDIYDMTSQLNTASSGILDIETSSFPTNRLFPAKFYSAAGNGTLFVKDSTFPYATATDIDLSSHYKKYIASATTAPPDSAKMGDIYIFQLRGDTTSYGAIKVLYVYPEDGRQGPGNDNEYILFNIKK
jgi:hypothetical protein